MNKNNISAFIITLNEEENIGDCIDSLDFCNEIILVDSGSSDRTIQIASSKGAKIFHNKFTGYTDQKNYALNLCSNEWVISLDADERVSPELKKYLIKTDLETTGFDGFELKRLYYFQNRWLKGGGFYPDYKTRIFRKSNGKFVGENIHEVVEVTGKVQQLNLDLFHYSWKDLNHLLTSQLKYAEKVAQVRFKQNKKASLINLLFASVFTFWHRYIIRQGFLDGLVGLELAIIFAFLSGYKAFRLWELNKNKS